MNLVKESEHKGASPLRSLSGGKNPSPPIRPKRKESYLVLRLVSPGVLAVCPVSASGLLFRFCLFVRSRLVLLALLRCLASSSGSVSFRFLKRGYDPGHRPKGPIFRLVSPSTYDLLGRGTGYWVFILFPIVPSCISFTRAATGAAVLMCSTWSSPSFVFVNGSCVRCCSLVGHDVASYSRCPHGAGVDAA